MHGHLGRVIKNCLIHSSSFVPWPSRTLFRTSASLCSSSRAPYTRVTVCSAALLLQQIEGVLLLPEFLPVTGLKLLPFGRVVAEPLAQLPCSGPRPSATISPPRAPCSNRAATADRPRFASRPFEKAFRKLASVGSMRSSPIWVGENLTLLPGRCPPGSPALPSAPRSSRRR